MVLRFKGKIRIVGNSFVVTIPKTYLDSGMLEKKHYNFQILDEEVNTDEQAEN